MKQAQLQLPFTLMNACETPTENPWLIDTKAILRDLDYIRELILKIPLHADTYLPAQSAIDAIWNLSYSIQFMSAVRAEQRRAGGSRDKITEQLTQGQNATADHDPRCA